MNPALGPFAIAAVLLVVAGTLKAARPNDTTLALRGMNLPATDLVVRAGGVGEAVLGVVALLTADVAVALLVAASYAAFGLFVAVALGLRRPIATCGCFGRLETPPSALHVLFSAVACVAAIGIALDASVTPASLIDGPLPDSAVYVVLVVAGVIAAFAALTVLPQTLRAAESTRARP